MTEDQSKDEEYEAEHVHAVYEQIATHFSSTRYKPWPIIESFLLARKPGSVGLDVGCGNGKYLAVNPQIYILASDRSSNLTSIARTHAPHSALVADILSLPHPARAFDFAISIAVIHHLSTPARRREAIASVLATLRPGGKALLYVWALEQESSRRGWSEGDAQDVMVPWVKKGSKREGERDRTFHRYYHLYRHGEMESDVVAAGGEVSEAGYEKDNWWVVAEPKAWSAH